MKIELALIRKPFILIICGLLISSQISADQKSFLSPAKQCSLTIGLSEWLPYQSVSDSGKPSGFQIDLLQQIASQAQCQLSYKSTTFSDGIKAVAEGELDFLMNSTATDERKHFANFSIPYRTEFLLLYSTPAWLAKCQTMSLSELILQGFRLGVQNDVIFGIELRDIQADPQLNRKLIYIDDDSPHADLVRELQLDGIIDDPVVVAYLSTVNKTGNSLSSCPIKISSAPVSFMFSKKSVPMEVVERFNQAIRVVQSTVEYKKRWSW